MTVSSDATIQTKVQHVNGGDALVVKSGGMINVEGGGKFQIGGIDCKIARGQTLTVSASDTIVTGLTQLFCVVANLDDAPTTDPEVATASIGDQAGSPTAGSFLLKTWKTLGGTPVAATTFSKKVNWIAIGT